MPSLILGPGAVPADAALPSGVRLVDLIEVTGSGGAGSSEDVDGDHTGGGGAGRTWKTFWYINANDLPTYLYIPPGGVDDCNGGDGDTTEVDYPDTTGFGPLNASAQGGGGGPNGGGGGRGFNLDDGVSVVSGGDGDVGGGSSAVNGQNGVGGSGSTGGIAPDATGGNGGNQRVLIIDPISDGGDPGGGSGGTNPGLGASGPGGDGRVRYVWTAPPTPGSNIVVTARSTTAISFSWGASSGGLAPYHYDIYRAPDAGGSPGTFSRLVVQTGTTYTDSTVVAHTKYWYHVRVYNDAPSAPNYGNQADYNNVSAVAEAPAPSGGSNPALWFYHLEG